MNELGFIDVNPIAIVQIIAAYLLGSIAFGILVSRLFGLPDPRTVGSGNPGATNVLRSGKKWRLHSPYSEMLLKDGSQYGLRCSLRT